MTRIQRSPTTASTLDVYTIVYTHAAPTTLAAPRCDAATMRTLDAAGLVDAIELDADVDRELSVEGVGVE